MSDSEDEIKRVEELKLVFLGDPAVGKTSIIRRFCYDDFSRNYNQTVGAEFYLKTVQLVKKREIKLRITDIGGHELNGHMLSNYLFNANIVAITYDITNTKSFEDIVVWVDAVRTILGGSIQLVVLGNKCDLEHKRAVRLDKTRHLVNEFRLVNYLVSAKTGENINLCLMDVIAGYYGVVPNRIEKVNRPPPVKRQEKVTNKAPDKVANGTKESITSVCCLQ